MRDREILVSQMVFDIKYCIKFFAHFEEDGKELFIYEYCKGGDLTELKNKQADKRFNEVKGKPLINQMVSAISELHKRRIVHRDIKPDNIFLTD